MAYVGFKNLKASLAKSSKVRNPGAVAASIGRKKYGRTTFDKSAASGTKMRGMAPAARKSKSPDSMPTPDMDGMRSGKKRSSGKSR